MQPLVPPLRNKLLLNAGADFVIATQEENLESRILEMSNGHGADLIFDAIAGQCWKVWQNAAAVGATIFIYGARGDCYPLPNVSNNW